MGKVSNKARTSVRAFFIATKENPMNEATRELVKRHLRDKEAELRMLQFEIKQDQNTLDRRRTHKEELECQIADLREDLEGPAEDDAGDAGTITVNLRPEVDLSKVKEAFAKINSVL